MKLRIHCVVIAMLAAAVFAVCPAAAQTAVALSNAVSHAAGVALDRGGNIFVADSGHGVVKEIVAGGGYVTVNTLGGSFANPVGVAVDDAGNVFVADGGAQSAANGGVYEILAAGGYSAVKPIASGYAQPTAIAVDAGGNVYVTNGGSPFNGTNGKMVLEELLAKSGFATAIAIDCGGYYVPSSIAIDGSGDLFLADNSGAIREALAVAGNVPASPAFKQIDGGNYVLPQLPFKLAVDGSGNLFLAYATNFDDSSAGGTVMEIFSGDGYATSKRVWSGLYSPGGLAIDAQGDLFFSDTTVPTNETVYSNPPSVSAVFELSSGPAYRTRVPVGSGFEHPYGVALDRSGNVLVADIGIDNMLSSSAAPFYTNVTTLAAGLQSPIGLARDAAGDLFVADGWGNTVREYMAPDYGRMRYIGSGYNAPNGIAVDASGNVFVADSGNQVIKEVLASDGYTTTLTIGPRFFQPQDVAVDRSGNVFVTGISDGLYELKAAEGFATTHRIGGPAGGVTLDGIDNLYVTDEATDGVLEYLAATGYATTKTIVTGAIPFGRSIALDPNGNIFVDQQEVELAVTEILPSGQLVNLPTGSGFYYPAGLVLDDDDNLIIAASLYGVLQKATAASSYTNVSVLGDGAFFNIIASAAVDAEGHVFVADNSSNQVKEILGGCGEFLCVTTIGSGFNGPERLALDADGNVFVADTGNNAVKEIVAAGGYVTVDTIGSGFNAPSGVALDGAGNVFVSDNGNSAVKEVLAADGYGTVKTIGQGLVFPTGLTVDRSGNVYVADAFFPGIKEITAASGYSLVNQIGTGFGTPTDVAIDAQGNLFVADADLLIGTPSVQMLLAGSPALVASVLPGSRTVELPNPATIFATIVNTGSALLSNCRVALSATAPAGLMLDYQTTDPVTNALTGTVDAPVTIQGGNGVRTFLLSFRAASPSGGTSIPLEFGCDDVPPAQSVPGVNTVDLIMGTAPLPDIVALASTPTANGIIEVPNGGSAAFAVASVNLGADTQITASVDIDKAPIPVAVTMCQTDPATAQCFAPPAGSVTLDFSAGATPTFSVFVQSTGQVALDPANARVFVRFEDPSELNRFASTSVAVETR